MKKLKRAGIFTDIHFGRKNNSVQHNEDCTAYIDWFITKCKEHEVDHIWFLGDWFEERDAVDSLTTKYAMNCATKLNALNIPIYFIVGNHDLYYRDNRGVFASYVYTPLSNFVIIDHPTVCNETLLPTLFSPYLFDEEYPSLSTYLDIPIWAGHFAFKGFILTGETFKKESGPDPDQFTTPDHIFSGHFHKRQHSKNVKYIGNAFPMDFGDANDNDRGMAIYDYEVNEAQYVNWEDCPKYMHVTLSQIQNDPSILYTNARVKVTADVDISYSDGGDLKEKLLVDYNLRELNIEENIVINVTETTLTEEEVLTESTSTLVRKMLGMIDSPDIDNDLLIEIYDGL